MAGLFDDVPFEEGGQSSASGGLFDDVPLEKGPQRTRAAPRPVVQPTASRPAEPGLGIADAFEIASSQWGQRRDSLAATPAVPDTSKGPTTRRPLPEVTVTAKRPAETTLAELPQAAQTQIGVRIENKLAGYEEESGSQEYREGKLRFWQTVVLPYAVRDAMDPARRAELGIRDLLEHPDVIAYAARAGVRPDVFARDWPKFANADEAELQAVRDMATQRIVSGEAQRNEGRRRRLLAAETGELYAPVMQQFSAKQLIFDTMVSAPDLMIAFGAGAATGSPVAGLATMAATIYPEMFAQGKNQGLSDERASTYATLQTMAEVVPEALPLTQFLDRSTGRLASSALKEVLQSVGRGAATEGASEMVTAALQVAIDANMIDPDVSLSDALKEIAWAGLVGAAPGGLIGGAGGAARASQPGAKAQFAQQQFVDQLTADLAETRRKYSPRPRAEAPGPFAAAPEPPAPQELQVRPEDLVAATAPVGEPPPEEPPVIAGRDVTLEEAYGAPPPPADEIVAAPQQTPVPVEPPAVSAAPVEAPAITEERVPQAIDEAQGEPAGAGLFDDVPMEAEATAAPVDEDAELAAIFDQAAAEVRGEKSSGRTVRMYHGGSPGDADGPLWFTSSIEDAKGWAGRSEDMDVWYVDVPEEMLGGDLPNGIVPLSRMELPAEIARGRKRLEQLPSSEAAPKEPPAKVYKPRNRPKPKASKDSLLEYLRKHDRGIDIASAASEAGFDEADLKKLGNASNAMQAFVTKGGMTMDEAAEHLAEVGYPVLDENGNYDPRKLAELIDSELRGQKVYSSWNTEWMDEQERIRIQQAEADERIRAEIAETRGKIETELQDPAWLNDRDATDPQAVDMASLIDAASQYDENAATAAVEKAESDEAAVEALRRIIQEGKTREGKRTSEGAAAVPQAQDDAAAQAGQQEGAEEGLTLTTQTEEELRAQAEQRAAQKKAEDDARKAAEQKAKADSEAKDFRLSGSDRPADVAAAGGQSSMFTASGKPREEQKFDPSKIDPEARKPQAFDGQKQFTEHSGIKLGDRITAGRGKEIGIVRRIFEIPEKQSKHGKKRFTPARVRAEIYWPTKRMIDYETRQEYGKPGVVQNLDLDKLRKAQEMPPTEAREEKASTEKARFDAWFSGSLITSNWETNGEPRRLYHITTAAFDEFKPSDSATGPLGKTSGPVIFLTDDKNNQPAAHSVGGFGGEFKDGANVMPLYASIKNPLFSDEKTRASDVQKHGLSRGFPRLFTQQDVDALKAAGYDGVVYFSLDETVNEIVAFDTTQLKSAIGNSGAFVPDSRSLTDAAPAEPEQGADAEQTAEIAEAFEGAQDSSTDDDFQVHHLFDPPAKSEVVRLQDKVRVYVKDRGWLSLDEAKARIEEWKAHAAAQGETNANGDKIVLSFFDLTGQWSQPWEDAGYQVWRFDIQNDPEQGDVNNFSVEFFGDWFGDFDGQDIYAILAACPCTDFASSGARHFAAKDADGRTVESVKLVQQTLAAIEYFKPMVWAIENPVGRIESLTGLPPWRLSFDPNHLGDPYTKKTLLWGRFNADLPIAPVEPTEGSKMHQKYGGKSQRTKNARSVTPEGFAYGFFMANNAVDNPDMAIQNKFDRLDKKLLADAVYAGMSFDDISQTVEDHYYMDLDDEAAEKALRAEVKQRRAAQKAKPSKKDIDDAASKAATSPKNDLPQPTQAQREAENYRAGDPVKLHGVTIRIENPRGSIRHNFDAPGIIAAADIAGVDDALANDIVDEYGRGEILNALRRMQRAAPDESADWWATKLGAHYGRILGTEGRDGDHVDVFLGPNAHDESRTVLVIDQIREDGSFDEHKVMLGFDDREAALAQFEGREHLVGAVVEMNPGAFRQWITTGDHQRPVNEWSLTGGRTKVRTTKRDIENIDTLGIKPDKAPAAPPEPADPRAAALIKEAAALGVKGADEALTGLAKLFGPPGTMRSFPGGFDEKTYAQAKPHFEAALKSFQEAGKKLAEFFQFLVRNFGESVRPYALRFAKEQGLLGKKDNLGAPAPGSTDVLDPILNTQPDPGAGDTQDAMGDETVQPAGERQGEGAGRPGRGTGQGRSPAAGSNELRDVRAPDGREPGDQRIHQPDGTFEPSQPAAGSDVAGGSAAPRGPRAADAAVGTPEAVPTLAPAEPDLTFKEKLERQLAAEKTPIEPGSRENIDATLPFLLPSQREDVHFGEKRLTKPDGYGVLFANGTGTGKTYVGLGMLKRAIRGGAKNGLLVVPSQQIANDWVESAKNLGITIAQLASTKDVGRGFAITTYANLEANEYLADRDYDVLLADEAHLLMQNAQAASTGALATVRALTLHPDGAYRRAVMKHRAKLALYDRLDAEVKARKRSINDADYSKAWRDWQDAVAQERQYVASMQGAKRPRAIFLSATPFAYEKNTAWAAGYLYELPKATRTGYGVPDGQDLFMVENFGYRMRYGKLTEPGPEVDRGIMQRAFAERLRKEGAMSYRVLEVDRDYERKFVSFESAVGNKIDEGLQYLKESNGGALKPLYDIVSKRFDYLQRSRLLEGLKAREAIENIRKQHALGRKVVVFHDFIEGGSGLVFDVTPFLSSQESVTYTDKSGRPKTVMLRDLAARFIEERPDLANLDTRTESPLEQLKAAFPQALEYNGRVSTKAKIQGVELFNSADPEFNLIIAQAAANAGWSAHDKIGGIQRVLINLGLPTAPVRSIQQEGRIYRVGQMSDAIFLYFNTGTSWERTAFAEKIAARASAAENMAMGNQARNLKDAFIEAFEDSAPNEPAPGDGKGGKARDRALVQQTDDFERAKTLYYSQLKRNQRTKSAEGADYFATPEPVGYKMVQWAGIRAGEAVLEPSAGHGAIARWFPDLTPRTIVERSPELFSKVSLVMSEGARLINDQFENLDIVNKYDAIVMNPPFGQGGSLAIPHLAKAFKHLRDGGRIVAIIPTGPAADGKFEKWRESEEAADAYVTADVMMPAGMFERAGTGIPSRLVIIDRVSKKAVTAGAKIPQPVSRQITADSINELFSRLKDAEMPPRVELSIPNPEAHLSEKAPVPAAPLDAPRAQYTVDSRIAKKDGATIYGARPTARLNEKFEAHMRIARSLGGWWAKFGKPGFEFKAEKSRDDFVQRVSEGGQPSNEIDGALQLLDASLDLMGGRERARKPLPVQFLRAHWNKIKGNTNIEFLFIDDLRNVPDQFKPHAAHLIRSGYESRWRAGVFGFRGGKLLVAFNSNAFDSLADFERTAAHELAHFGMHAWLGESYQEFADRAYAALGRSAFKEQIRTYFGQPRADGSIDTSRFDPTNPQHRLRVVDELAASLAEGMPRETKLRAWLDQLYSWIQSKLREMGWRRTFSQTELRHIVRGARDLAMSGKVDGTTVTGKQLTDVEMTVLGLSLDKNAAEGARRQGRLWRMVREGRPIDQIFRIQFEPFGLIQADAAGNYTTSPRTRKAAMAAAKWLLLAPTRPFSALAGISRKAAHNMLDIHKLDQIDYREAVSRNEALLNRGLEHVKHGLVDRYGVPIEFIEREQDALNEASSVKLAVSQLLMPAMNSAMTFDEAKSLYLVLTGQQVDDGTFGALPVQIRETIDFMGLEMVKLGLLSRETYERNRGTYLHRIYMKHEEQRAERSPLTNIVEEFQNRRRRKLIGKELRMRGIKSEVTLERLQASLPPDWWGRKFSGKDIDVALGETKWIVLDRIADATDEATQAKLFPSGKDKPGRVIARVYWPADLPVPPKFAGYTNRGTFEVRNVTTGKVTLWRDYTPDERKVMGEIMDARYVTMRTAMLMADDIATARLYKDMSENPAWARRDEPVDSLGNPLWQDGDGRFRNTQTFSTTEWVRVPETKVRGTSVQKYGALAGMYVRSAIWRDMVQLENQQLPGWWRELLAMWKKNKTVWSIKTHFFNFISNFGMADLADLRLREIKQAAQHIFEKDAEYQDAIRYGVFGSGEAERRINIEVMQPLLRQLMNEQIDESDAHWLPKMMMVMHRWYEKTDNFATGAYQMEDSLFRMAMYVKMTRQGHQPRHAAAMARAQFVDYDIRAPWINATRYTALPFISYTYRVIPLLAEALISRPWKIYKWYVMMALSSMLFSTLAGDDDEDLEDIHNLIPEDMKGTTFLGTPRAIRLWYNDENGNPVIYDLRNNIPGSNIFGLQGFTQNPWIPATLAPGGPLVIAAEMTSFNQSVVTGQAIIDPDSYNADENLRRYIKHTYQAWMPDAPYIPFSRSWDRIVDSVGRTNDAGELFSPGQAVMSSLGIKVSSVNLEIQLDRRMDEFDRKARAKRRLISDLNRAYRNQTAERTYFPTEKYEEELERLQREIAEIERSRAEFLASLSPQFGKSRE